jgi:hypothetical protein
MSLGVRFTIIGIHDGGHDGGNEFDRSARGVEKAHLGRTNCDCHSVKPVFFLINNTKSMLPSSFLFNKMKCCRYTHNNCPTIFLSVRLFYLYLFR